MSEWTPEDAARLAELLAQLRDDQAAVVDDGYEHRCHVASPAQTAALAHALDHIEGLEAKRAHMQRVCVLTREEAEAFCDLRDRFVDEPNAITITCEEDGATAEVLARLHAEQPKYVIECQNDEYGEWTVGPFASRDDACEAITRMEAASPTSAELVRLESWEAQQEWLTQAEADRG